MKHFFVWSALLNILLSYSQTINSQKDSLKILYEPTLQKSFFDKKGIRMTAVPAVFFTASAASWNYREDVREMRNRYIPNFKVPYDDYLQYAPTAAVYGLNLAGIKGRNNLKRATYSYATSVALMALMVNAIKYTAKVERPDGSTRNSFPSGHTATAFTNATFLHKEYGPVDPAYSIGGYSMATLTGFGRNLNNRHWISDVLAGAGIGILSTELGYFFIDKFYKNEGDNIGLLSKVEGNGNPSFIALKAGYATASTNFLKESELDNEKEKGFEVGIEGAYFFHKKWGIGGELGFASFPTKSVSFDLDDPALGALEVETESIGFLNFGIGPYFAHDLTERWQLTAKSFLGYAIPADGKIIVRNPNIDLPNNELEAATYSPSKSFRWTNGLALTYKFNDEIGLTAYADYHTSNATIRYSFNELLKDDQEMEDYFNDTNIKEKINYFTFGLRLTAFF